MSDSDLQKHDLHKNDRHKQVAISFLQSANWLNAEISRLLEPYDLTLQQLKVLSIIYQAEAHRATVNQIKEQMIDPSSNVSRLLNKLMDKKLISKVRSEDDQRVVHIHISLLGQQLMCEGKEAMDQGMAVMNKLTAAELSQLEQLMDKLRS